MTAPRTSMIYRQAAGDKAAAAGLNTRYIRQHGTADDCWNYVNLDIWAEKWGEPKPYSNMGMLKLSTPAVNTGLPEPQATPEPVNIPLPVQTIQTPAVNTGLPVKKKVHKRVLTNGRDSKGIPKFENWFCRIYPRDITYPAWKELSKTATDIANICRAKRDHAKAGGKKDPDGTPSFEFTFAEAANFFKISRPTFDKSIKQLLDLGFIEYANRGGIVDGKGIPARYRCSECWRDWKPENPNLNLVKETPATLQALIQKQNPSKHVLHKPVNTGLPVGGKIC